MGIKTNGRIGSVHFLLNHYIVLGDRCCQAKASEVSKLKERQAKQRKAGYWVAGTRISLDSVVYSFLDGESPESISQNFPLLSLEQVYGAITFYLANREFVDAYLDVGEAEYQVA